MPAKKTLCIVAAMLAIVFALVAPAAFACDGCNGGGQVFSAPQFAPMYAPQVLAAPVYQPQVFAAPVYQRQVVFAAPQRAVVQKQVVVARAPRQPLFNFRGRSVSKTVVRGNGVVAGAAVVY